MPDGRFCVKDCAPRMRSTKDSSGPDAGAENRAFGRGACHSYLLPAKRRFGNLVPESVIASNHIRYLNLDQQVRLTTDVP